MSLRPMDDVTLARAIHVLAVVLWIGGGGLVTTVLLPAVRRLTLPFAFRSTGAVCQGTTVADPVASPTILASEVRHSGTMPGSPYPLPHGNKSPSNEPGQNKRIEHNASDRIPVHHEEDGRADASAVREQ